MKSPNLPPPHPTHTHAFKSPSTELQRRHSALPSCPHHCHNSALLPGTTLWPFLPSRPTPTPSLLGPSLQMQQLQKTVACFLGARGGRGSMHKQGLAAFTPPPCATPWQGTRVLVKELCSSEHCTQTQESSSTLPPSLPCIVHCESWSCWHHAQPFSAICLYLSTPYTCLTHTGSAIPTCSPGRFPVSTAQSQSAPSL